MAHIQTTAFELFETQKEFFIGQAISQATNIQWSIDFLIENHARLDWKELSGNPSLPWSMELIGLFETRWDWNAISWIIANREFIEPNELMTLVARHGSELDWNVISCGDNLSLEVVEQYTDDIDWSTLSSNIVFPWSRDFLSKYQDKINWNLLSQNFILKYIDQFFNIRTLELFQDRFNWESLSENRNLKWSIRLISKFREQWDWDRLIDNHGIEWNIRMVTLFNEYIPVNDTRLLHESYLWESLIQNELRPYRKLSETEELLANFKD